MDMNHIFDEIMLSVKKQHSEIFNTMLADSQGQKVTFMVKEKRFYAPSVLLSAQSDVLAKMLDDELKEAKEKCVNIENIEPEVFSELLRFLVAGAVSNNEAFSIKLLGAAEMVMSEP